MVYLDSTSNPGSKPQRLGATNCKISTSDKRGISCKRNHRIFQENKEENQLFERKCPVLMAAWLYPT